MKIFVFGLGQLNFLKYLYSSVAEFNPNLNTTVIGPQFNIKNSTPEKSEYLNYLKISTAWLYLVPIAIMSVFNKHFWKIFFLIAFVESKPLKALHFVYKWIYEGAFFKENNSFRSADILHFHYMQYSYLRMIYFVPNNKKVICSFWGSDLLRTHDLLNHHITQYALNRANVITIQSLELREIILAKFGRHLKSKISIIKFSLDERIFKSIDSVNDKSIDEFRSSLGVPNNKAIVMVGNNANPMNNHLKIIDGLANVDNKKDLYLLFAFNYGLDEKRIITYKNSIIERMNNMDIQYGFIDHYLHADQLAILRKATAIMIQMPESDALSGAATEIMYAGGLVITANWLPYGPFHEAGLFFYSISSYEQLSERIQFWLANKEKEMSNCMNNKEVIRQHFFPHLTGSEWNRLFNSI